MARRGRSATDRHIAEWNFRTFPVFFGFCLGAFLATLILADAELASVLFIVSLFGVSFSIAHIIGHTLRRRGLDRAVEHEEEMERERRALAARNAASLEGESHSIRRRRRRRT
jgi:hypothetical protein